MPEQVGSSAAPYRAPSWLVCLVSAVSFVFLVQVAIFDDRLTIGGYVVCSLLALWALFLSLVTALETYCRKEDHHD